jgi:hypothetical protein
MVVGVVVVVVVAQEVFYVSPELRKSGSICSYMLYGSQSENKFTMDIHFGPFLFSSNKKSSQFIALLSHQN